MSICNHLSARRRAPPGVRWTSAAFVALALLSSTAAQAQVTDATPRHRQGPAGEYHVFHDFNQQFGTRAGIAFPDTSLTQAPDGYLYGTTYQSGRGGDASFLGAIYRVAPDGRVNTVMALTEDTGGILAAGVTAGSDGNLYGATIRGGVNGTGVIFRLAPDRTFTQLFSFDCLGLVGCQARGALVEAPDGSFYGTASKSIYRLMPDGSVNAVYRLYETGDGPRSDKPVTVAPDGVVYSVGPKAVYRLAVDGHSTVLHTLDEATEGSDLTGLMLASDGNLYGTTTRGGPAEGGTLFRLNRRTGELTVLHAFAREGSLGGYVQPQVPVQGADGLLYGITTGSILVDVGDKVGTLWRSTLGGRFETLMYFSPAGGDARIGIGYAPARLTATADGRIVGPTRAGGLYGDGALFVLQTATP